MGNDGGAHVNKRIDMAKDKKKQVKQGHMLLAKDRATLCNLSRQKLKHPIAVCRLGNLYNYDDVVRALINKSIPSHIKHISKLKNIKKLAQSNKQNNKNTDSEYIVRCDLSGEEFNGINKFVCMWKCGCVILQRLAQQKKCPVCGKEGPSISLNLTKEEQTVLQNQLVKAAELQKEKSMKKKAALAHQELNQKEEETKLEKKVKKEIQNEQQPKQFRSGLLEQLVEMGNESKNQSESFRSLFHKEYETDTGLFRSSKFGIR